MILIILLLIVLSILFLVKGWVNKYSWPFVFLTLSLSLAMYSVMKMIAIKGNYFPVGFIGYLDEKFFNKIAFGRISYFAVVRIFNISVAVFISSLVIFMSCYFMNVFKKSSFKEYAKKIPVFIFPILYVWFYDRTTTSYFYHQIMRGEMSYNVLAVFDLIFTVILFLYMILPVVYMYVKIKRTSLYYKKRQLYGVMVFIILLDLIFTLIYRLPYTRDLYVFKDVSDLISVTDVLGISERDVYILFPAILIFICIMYIVMFRFDITPRTGIVGKAVYARKIHKINQNSINMFHSVKKTMFMYKIMAETALSQDGSECKNTVKNLVDEIDKYIDRLTKMLDVNNDPEIFMENFNLVDIINDACNNYARESGITFEKHFIDNYIGVNADSFYLEEVFDNIIKNSIDAIKRKKDSGTIKIKVDYEHEWIVIKITDDGEGISKKNLKNIFKPLFTTKSRVNNWGVGLSFVSKIVKIHMGHIYAESVLGESTTITVLLPRI